MICEINSTVINENKKAIQNFVKILRKNYIKNAHK